jgi:sentrin-specific protease 1
MSQAPVIHNSNTEDSRKNVWNLGNLREALNEKQEEEEEEEEESQQRNVARSTVLHSPPADDKNQLVKIWNEGRDSSRNKLWCTIANNPITSYDLSTLQHQQELNDVIINSYLELLSKRSSSSPSHPKCRFFISFFYTCLVPRLGCYDYSRVRRWTSKANINILDYDKIFIPLNLPGHWVLTVINLFEKRFELYDSLHGRSNHLKVLKRYLMDEIEDKAPKFLSSPSYV